MHTIDGLPLGGAERMLVDLANATVLNGDRVSACVTRTCTDLAGELDEKVTLHVLGRRQSFDLQAMRRFAAVLRKNNVQLLHAHSRSTFSMLALMKALRWIRVPIVLHDHYGSVERDFSVPAWFRFASRYYLDGYVGVYAKLGEWARHAGIDPSRISVIGNSLNLARLSNVRGLDLRREFNIAPEARVGVAVAGIRHDKGIDVLLRALASKPLPAETKILIVGGDADPVYGADCRHLAMELGLTDSVLFLGRRSDVPAIINGADFALMPSRSESGPLVLIEYMAAGLPFVSTRVGDVAHKTEENGIPGFVTPDSPDCFRSELDNLLALSTSEWEKRGEQGKLWAMEAFDIQQALAQWQKVYSKVLHHN